MNKNDTTTEKKPPWVIQGFIRSTTAAIPLVVALAIVLVTNPAPIWWFVIGHFSAVMSARVIDYTFD